MTTKPITLETRIRRAEDAAWRIIDGQAVVVSADAQRMRVLNEVGSRIWDLADGRCLKDISQTLVAEFDAEPAQIESDTIAFATDLVARGMLVIAEA